MNILTFDLEDWFHILDHPPVEKPEQWSSLESRLERNVELILDLLERKNQKATWFCLGWIAKKYPALVKRIAEKHEIACHSDVHQLVYKQSQQEFREDTMSVKKRVEDLLGKKISTYRASGFSITAETKWAFEILSECGIETDCSIFPAIRNHGGFPGFTPEPCRVKINGITIKEFPLNISSFMGMKLVFSGGGYFRLLPYWLIRRLTAKSGYVMSYFHPRDFDPDQPMLSTLPAMRKLMSYSGLKYSKVKLERWLDEFTFTDLRTVNQEINWTQTRVVEL